MRMDDKRGEVEGTLTWHQKPGRVRADFVSEVYRHQVDVTIIAGPGYPSSESYDFCVFTAGTCVRVKREGLGFQRENIPPEAILFNAVSEWVPDATPLGFGIFEATSSDTLAGEEASCFEIEGAPKDGFETRSLCATEEGIILRLRQKGPGHDVSFEATRFKREASEGVFDLPLPLETPSSGTELSPTPVTTQA